MDGRKKNRIGSGEYNLGEGGMDNGGPKGMDLEEDVSVHVQ